MKDIPCLCDGRTDIECTDDHCSIAGPGEPHNMNSCRICWLRLGKPEIKGPGLLQKAVNFAGAVANHLATGAHAAPPEVIEERMAICKGCDYYNQEDESCKHKKCGCRMKVKSSWLDASCPIQKW